MGANGWPRPANDGNSTGAGTVSAGCLPDGEPAGGAEPPRSDGRDGARELVVVLDRARRSREWRLEQGAELSSPNVVGDRPGVKGQDHAPDRERASLRLLSTDAPHALLRYYAQYELASDPAHPEVTRVLAFGDRGDSKELRRLPGTDSSWGLAPEECARLAFARVVPDDGSASKRLEEPWHGMGRRVQRDVSWVRRVPAPCRRRQGRHDYPVVALRELRQGGCRAGPGRGDSHVLEPRASVRRLRSAARALVSFALPALRPGGRRPLRLHAGLKAESSQQRIR
jgi:hypothetical protein